MKVKTKSVLSVVLTLVMLLGILPLSAFAADDGYGYTYDSRGYRYYDYYDYYYYRYNDRDSDYYRYNYSDYYYNRGYDSGYYYYGYYDDDLYRRSKSYLPDKKVLVENASGQLYTGVETISFTIPEKNAVGLCDVVVYPKDNRNKEVILTKGTDFKVETGRLTVKLTDSFLKTLDNGKYEVIIYFVTSQGYASFEVKY